MQVSVAMATYDGAKYLVTQLQSLVDQSYRPLEIVIADDGSSDDTLNIIKDFSKNTDIPIIILPSATTLGYRLNFRRAAQACSGDLIAFCDQDDVWREDKLARIVPYFSDQTTKLVYHNAIVFSADYERDLYNSHEEQMGIGEKEFSPFKSSNGLVQVFRASLRDYDHLWDMSIDHHEGDTILAHDQWFFFLALLLGKVEFVDLPLLRYRQHQSNTYGVRARVGFFYHFSQKFVHFGEQDIWASRSAKSRADIARSISALENNRDMLIIAERYERLSVALENRSKVYRDSGIFNRLSALIVSLSHGDYGNWKWSFRKTSIIRDLWKGLVLHQWHDYSRS